MSVESLRLRILLPTLSGWIRRHQQDAIEYLIEENRVLKEQLGGRRMRLTDDQRRRLAAKAKVAGAASWRPSRRSSLRTRCCAGIVT